MLRNNNKKPHEVKDLNQMARKIAENLQKKQKSKVVELPKLDIYEESEEN